MLCIFLLISQLYTTVYITTPISALCCVYFYSYLSYILCILLLISQLYVVYITTYISALCCVYCILLLIFQLYAVYITTPNLSSMLCILLLISQLYAVHITILLYQIYVAYILLLLFPLCGVSKGLGLYKDYGFTKLQGGKGKLSTKFFLTLNMQLGN